MENNSLLHDARRFSFGWRIWFWILVLANVIGPLFFLNRLEAWVILGAYALAGAVIFFLHRRFGWVRLLGLGHFPWLVVVPWLASRYLTTSPRGALGGLMLAIILIDGTSLIIDIVDVVRYLAGDRQPIVEQAG